MGMFDEVLCNHALFGVHKGEMHQTKDLHPLGGMLEHYEITPAGRLERLEYRIEDRSDSTREGTMATLLIDDQRNLPADRIARTYCEGIAALAEQHWDVLYLDHELGDCSGPDGRELTGYDIDCWLERNPQHLPGRVEIVTNNPAGRSRIEFALGRIRPRESRSQDNDHEPR